MTAYVGFQSFLHPFKSIHLSRVLYRFLLAQRNTSICLNLYVKDIFTAQKIRDVWEMAKIVCLLSILKKKKKNTSADLCEIICFCCCFVFIYLFLIYF